MALEYSKQLAIAEKQKREGRVDQERIRGQLFAETFRIRLLSVSSEKAGIQIKRGYLPTYVPDADGKLQPNVVIGADGKPVMGTDGKPVFHEYAFLPDIL